MNNHKEIWKICVNLDDFVTQFRLFLPFSDLQIEDSGIFTCTASTESGETSWSASLTVSRKIDDSKFTNLQLKLPFWIYKILLNMQYDARMRRWKVDFNSQESKLILDYFWIFNQVEKSSSNVIPQRSPDPSTLPTAPSEPKLINVSSTSITLGWSKVQLKQGGTSFFGYTVEYFSSDQHKSWITAAQRVANNVVTVSWFSISYCRF